MDADLERLGEELRVLRADMLSCHHIADQIYQDLIHARDCAAAADRAYAAKREELRRVAEERYGS